MDRDFEKAPDDVQVEIFFINDLEKMGYIEFEKQAIVSFHLHPYL